MIDTVKPTQKFLMQVGQLSDGVVCSYIVTVCLLHTVMFNPVELVHEMNNWCFTCEDVIRCYRML